MKNTWLSTVIDRPWLTLVVGILFVVICSMGASKLTFRGDYKVFFDEFDENKVTFEKMQQIFSKNSSATIVIAPHSGDAFDKDTLLLIKNLTEDAWQTPYSNRVDSVTNYQHTFAEEDDLLVEDLLMDDTELTPQKMAQMRQIALNEPNLVKRLVSPTGHVSVVNITVQLPEVNTTLEVKQVAEFVEALTQRYRDEGAKADFYLAGIVIMNNSFANEAQSDATTLVPGMFLMILVMLGILLRSITGTLITMVIIIFSVATTMGLAGWLGFFMSTPTVNVPTIVMTLVVADCVHVIGSMLYMMRQGSSRKEAIRHSMKLNLVPVFVTSATTAIGFLTINFSNVPVLRDLGNLTALGVMIAFLYSVTLLPAMLRLLPMRVAVEAQTSGRMERFAEWVIRHHRLLLPVTAITMVGLSFFISLNKVNDEATKYFAHSTTFRQAIDFMEENISGMGKIDFALYTGKESGINDPAFLASTQKFVDWLEQQPEVNHVATITNTFKRLNQNMHGDDPAYYKLPEQQDLAAQYLLMYEMSLPYGLDLNNQINLDKSALRIVATVNNMGSHEYTEFERNAIAWAESNIEGISAKAGSPLLIFSHVGEQNMISMLKSLPLALVLISLCLVFALRSWRLGLISLLPNIMPAAVGFGIWGLWSGEINLGLSVVTSISLGIIVDDTVHFLSKYKYAREEGKTTEDAIRYAFASVGRALWITTLVLLGGFTVLAFSGFRLNSDLGLSTGIILSVALAIDFLFLPAFLLVFDRENKSGKSADKPSIKNNLGNSSA
jgi:predicted RND superfamily exporter protein